MNDATRHDTATIDATHTTETQAQLRDRLGVNPRTMQRRWRDMFGVSFAANRVATLEEVAQIEQSFLHKKEVRARIISMNPEPIQAVGDSAPVQSICNDTPTNLLLVWVPLIAASLASIRNMWIICLHLNDGDLVSTAISTALFSLSALAFIGSRTSWKGLTSLLVVLIGFEAFANAIGIYYGLLGRTGTPTRFLGMVTDVLESGTHYTAIGLGITMAFITGYVQLASVRVIIQNIK